MTLILERASYRYPGAREAAVEDVNLRVDGGEILGLVGSNDGGKSTLCLLAAGLAPMTLGGHLDGRVLLDGVRTTDLRPGQLASAVGILFQNPTTQLSGTTRTVYEEIAFGPRNLGWPLAKIVDRVEWAMESLAVTALAARDPSRLSGGQAQLIALASVLAMAPAHLVLDEPTSQLDPRGTQLVGDALSRLAEQGIALLLVEHKTDLLERLARRVAVLADGRIVAEGPASRVLADPALQREGVEAPTSVGLSRALARHGLALDPGLLAEIGNPGTPDAGHPRSTTAR